MSGRKPDEDFSEHPSCKGCLNLEDELASLNRQVRMISESLAACKKMSRYRPPKRDTNYAMKTTVRPRPIPQTPVEILLPPEERTLEYFTQSSKNDFIVSYMIKENDFAYLQKSKTFFSREEILSRNCSGDSEDDIWPGESSSREELPEFCEGTSKVGMYNHDEVDPKKMIAVIQRELKVLMEMVPALALSVSGLSDAFFHYKKCYRCNKKISPSLPWILNRIQKLIKYLTTKNNESYYWPNDYNSLRLSVKNPPKKKDSGSHRTSELASLTSEKPKPQIGRLERVDPTVVSDDKPGVQILLEVKPEKARKRLFVKSENQKVVEESVEIFPTFRLSEPSANPLVQILRPENKHRVSIKRKQEVLSLKGYSVSRFYIYTWPKAPICFPASIQVPVGAAIKFRTARSQVYPKPIEPYEEIILKHNKGSLCSLTKHIGYLVKEEEIPRKSSEERPWKRKSDLRSITFKNGSDLVQELLEEARGSKMQVQKVKELESEVKGLKDLMLEVHKNQMELSKLLLEKGVYSQPMIRLTDPNMLEEENKLVKKATQIEVSGRRSTSLESLQLTVDELKRKCSIKNRMIVTLLKGLRSNVPKEWWEELVDYIFDESKPIDEFDPEKVTEFMQQTSLFLLNGEKASSVSPPRSRTEDLASEEEPKTKGNVGAELENVLISLLCNGNESNASSRCKLSDVLDDRGQLVKYLVFPAVKIPEPDAATKSMLRKLENQISLLNTENERLWHQVNELRDLLKTTISEVDRERSRRESDQPPEVRKSTGKTINLTIQIGDRGLRRKDGDVYTISTGDDTAVDSPSDDQTISVAKSPRAQKVSGPEVLKIPYAGSRRYQLRLKSDRRHSQNDLNYLDEEPSTYIEQIKQIKVTTPHPSAQNLYRRKEIFQHQPVVWDVYQAGVSSGSNRDQVDLGYLLQKPSIMELTEKQNSGMFATMANERELQTIPENDHADCNPSSSSSKSVGQAIQRLRTRVRSIHKDVSILKTKNDRIDKLLDRLVDDVADNNQHFEKMETDLNNFKHRLG